LALKIVVGARELLTGNRKRVLGDFTWEHPNNVISINTQAIA
jgi:hypothetical protein